MEHLPDDSNKCVAEASAAAAPPLTVSSASREPVPSSPLRPPANPISSHLAVLQSFEKEGVITRQQFDSLVASVVKPGKNHPFRGWLDAFIAQDRDAVERLSGGLREVGAHISDGQMHTNVMAFVYNVLNDEAGEKWAAALPFDDSAIANTMNSSDFSFSDLTPPSLPSRHPGRSGHSGHSGKTGRSRHSGHSGHSSRHTHLTDRSERSRHSDYSRGSSHSGRSQRSSSSSSSSSGLINSDASPAPRASHADDALATPTSESANPSLNIPDYPYNWFPLSSSGSDDANGRAVLSEGNVSAFDDLLDDVVCLFDLPGKDKLDGNLSTAAPHFRTPTAAAAVDKGQNRSRSVWSGDEYGGEGRAKRKHRRKPGSDFGGMRHMPRVQAGQHSGAESRSEGESREPAAPWRAVVGTSAASGAAVDTASTAAEVRDTNARVLYSIAQAMRMPDGVEEKDRWYDFQTFKNSFSGQVRVCRPIRIFCRPFVFLCHCCPPPPPARPTVALALPYIHAHVGLALPYINTHTATPLTTVDSSCLTIRNGIYYQYTNMHRFHSHKTPQEAVSWMMQYLPSMSLTRLEAVNLGEHMLRLGFFKVADTRYGQKFLDQAHQYYLFNDVRPYFLLDLVPIIGRLVTEYAHTLVRGDAETSSTDGASANTLGMCTRPNNGSMPRLRGSLIVNWLLQHEKSLQEDREASRLLAERMLAHGFLQAMTKSPHSAEAQAQVFVDDKGAEYAFTEAAILASKQLRGTVAEQAATTTRLQSSNGADAAGARIEGPRATDGTSTATTQSANVQQGHHTIESFLASVPSGINGVCIEEEGTVTAMLGSLRLENYVPGGSLRPGALLVFTNMQSRESLVRRCHEVMEQSRGTHEQWLRSVEAQFVAQGPQTGEQADILKMFADRHDEAMRRPVIEQMKLQQAQVADFERLLVFERDQKNGNQNAGYFWQ